MLFTWSTKDLCIVFRGWHIDSTFTLIWSLLAIVALGAGYELLREITRQYEFKTAARLEAMPRKPPSSISPPNAQLRPYESVFNVVRWSYG